MLRRSSTTFWVSTFFALLLTAAMPASAQVDRGAIEGVVTDPTGARLSNAQVTLTNRDTGQSVRMTTDLEGNYNAKLLKIGLGASFWRLTLPFKCAPSSMEMRCVVISPTTMADCFKSTRSLA